MRFCKRAIVGFLIGACLALGVGCYGSMALTKKVYVWNGTVPDKFVRSLVFDVLLIVPVYEITTFVDVVLLNPIEFWSGSNPAGVSQAAPSPQKPTRLARAR